MVKSCMGLHLNEREWEASREQICHVNNSCKACAIARKLASVGSRGINNCQQWWGKLFREGWW